MPAMPHMPPAAIGCTLVRFCGDRVSSYRCPRPASTASGQPSPEDELTVTMSPSATRSAAWRAVSTRGMCIGEQLLVSAYLNGTGQDCGFGGVRPLLAGSPGGGGG